ncbi:MAG TPA: aldo/keto reductase [Miltoncostaeaceae bacterium]|nr:aldo/keto reductase [Miltoncostaeaceae bacterium]
MRSITLGRTGLEVSRIAFGTWQLGGEWGSFDEAAAIDAIRGARDLGITLFDTAQAYGFGASEELLGRALRPELTSDREGVVIATKGGIRPPERDASRAFLRQGVEESLRHLGVDVIDVYQVHWPDRDVPAEETAGALQEMVDEGKIRFAGVSNYGVADMEAFEAVRPVDTLQPPYHLFQRTIESEILSFARAHDIGVLAYSPLASGLLAGRIDEDTTFEPDDWRGQASAYAGEALRRNLAVVRQLEGLAADLGISLSQLAIAWVLAQPGVHVAIVGARSRGNIAASAAAGEVELSPEALARIDEIAADAEQIEGATPEGVL